MSVGGRTISFSMAVSIRHWVSLIKHLLDKLYVSQCSMEGEKRTMYTVLKLSLKVVSVTSLKYDCRVSKKVSRNENAKRGLTMQSDHVVSGRARVGLLSWLTGTRNFNPSLSTQHSAAFAAEIHMIDGTMASLLVDAEARDFLKA